MNVERTGWRDERISLRHRMWGDALWLVDIDWVVVEYGAPGSIARALVEYKNEHATWPVPKDGNHDALVDLADRAAIPLFAVRYADDFSWFVVVGLNGLGLRRVPLEKRGTELAYVKFLYSLRGLSLPDQVRQALTPAVPVSAAGLWSPEEVRAALGERA